MDNLTHTLVGVGLSRSGLNKRFGRAGTWVLAISSNLPDLDVFGALFLKRESFLYRRMFTHGIIGVPLIALVAAIIFRRFFRQLTFFQTFALTLLGMVVHVIFDLINSYGVAFLYPVSWQRFELSWVFIIDLFLWALLILPVVLTRFKPFKGQPVESNIFKVGMILVVGYIGTCGALHWQSTRLLKKVADTKAAPASFVYAFPEALGAHRFKGVIRFSDGYEVYRVYPLTGKVTHVQDFQTSERSEEYQKVKDNPRVRQLNWFFKAPVWKVRRFEGDGVDLVRLECFDLRFISTVLPMKRPPFTFDVYSDQKITQH